MCPAIQAPGWMKNAHTTQMDRRQSQLIAYKTNAFNIINANAWRRIFGKMFWLWTHRTRNEFDWQITLRRNIATFFRKPMLNWFVHTRTKKKKIIMAISKLLCSVTLCQPLHHRWTCFRTRYLCCSMFRIRYYSCHRKIYFYDSLSDAMIDRCWCGRVIDDDSFDVGASWVCCARLSVWWASANWC